MDENKTVFFRGEIIHTLDVLKEYHNAFRYFDKYAVLVHIVISVLLLLSMYAPDFSGFTQFVVLFFTAFVLARHFSNQPATIYERMLSQNEGIPIHQTCEFNNYHIHTVQTHTGNQIDFQYSAVTGLAQTKHYLVLLLAHRQFLLLDKSKLIGGDQESFVRFLCNACPNLSPKKLRSNTIGMIIYYAMFVLLCCCIVICVVYHISDFWLI